MSVEEARKAIEEGDSCWGVDPKKVDRLILEVQAEMPCYDPGVDWQAMSVSVPSPAMYDAMRKAGRDPTKPRTCGKCLPCIARMKLKEVTA